jgi:hypothetical protein
MQLVVVTAGLRQADFNPRKPARVTPAGITAISPEVPGMPGRLTNNADDNYFDWDFL